MEETEESKPFMQLLGKAQDFSDNGSVQNSSSPLFQNGNQGAKYLVFVSSRSVKLRELSFAQFVYFLGKVCLFFNF